MSKWLPWQQQQSEALLSQLQEGRLPHALLLTGSPGLGKREFSRSLAAVLLCQQRGPDGTACGECRGCQLYQAQTHPDILEVTLLEEKKIIGIDQIRAVGDYLSLKSQFGGHKIVIVAPADRMNVSAANGLLKTLEEPPAWSLLILITALPAALPATIRSRCQQMAFAAPPLEMARKWLGHNAVGVNNPDLALRLCHGAPLAAVAVATGDWLERRRVIFDGFEKILLNQGDPVSIAAEWLKYDPPATIYCLYSWVTDMIRLKTGTDPEAIVNRDIADRLQRVADACMPQTLFSGLDAVGDVWRCVDSQLNTQLLFENLLIEWADRKPDRISTVR